MIIPAANKLDPFQILAFSQDNEKVAIGGRSKNNESMTIVFNIKTHDELFEFVGEERGELPFFFGTRCISFSPNGKWIAAGDSYRNAKIYNLETKSLHLTLEVNDSIKKKCNRPGYGYVTCLTYSTNSEKLFTGTDIGEIKVWNNETGHLEHVIERSGCIKNIKYCSNSNSIISSSTVEIIIFDKEKYIVQDRIVMGLYHATVLFSPDENKIAIHDFAFQDRISIYDIDGGNKFIKTKTIKHNFLYDIIYFDTEKVVVLTKCRNFLEAISLETEIVLCTLEITGTHLNSFSPNFRDRYFHDKNKQLIKTANSMFTTLNWKNRKIVLNIRFYSKSKIKDAFGVWSIMTNAALFI
jgi:WD40 repeat protein